MSDPLGELVALYTIRNRQYDKAWEMVHRAEEAGRRIAPELIDRLKNRFGAQQLTKQAGP